MTFSLRLAAPRASGLSTMSNHPNRSRAPFHCAYCGKPARKRTVTVFVKHEGDFHNSTSDGPWFRSIFLPKGTDLHSLADCQRHSNMQVVHVKYHDYRDTDALHRGRVVWQFSEWDGESWELGKGKFCTANCAHCFANAALKAGYVIQRKGE